MIKVTKSVLLTLVASYALGIVACTVYSYFTVPNLGGGAFRGEWIFSNTVTLFLRNLLPLHFSALVFVYSLFFNPLELKADGGDLRQGFLNLVKKSLILFLVLAAGYTLLLEALLPREIAVRKNVALKAAAAEDAMTRAKTAMELQKYDEAAYYLEFFLTLHREDADAKKRLEKIMSIRKAAEVTAARLPKEPSETPRPVENLTVGDMIARAWDYYDKEDFISAEYYAGLALKFDDSRPEPKRIISLSREKISKLSLSKEEREKVTFFQNKREGYEMLSRGEYIAAYWHLKKLNEQNPKDPDVRNYLATAREGLAKESFFLDEVSLVSNLPLFDHVLFLNRETDGVKEFLYFKRIIQTYTVKKASSPREITRKNEHVDESSFWYRLTHLFFSESEETVGMAYYVVDVEGLGLGPDGKVRYHFTAPYGKFIDRMLVLRCLQRTGGEELRPVYLKGSPPEKSPYQIPMQPSPDDLRLLSLGKTDVERLQVWTLFSLAPLYRAFGLDEVPVYHAFFEHLFFPFAFIVLSFFALGLGWRFKSRYLARPPIACFLFLPVLPVLAGLFFELYHYLWRLLAVSSLAAWGFYPALAIFLALQGVFLALALVFVAAQVNR